MVKAQIMRNLQADSDDELRIALDARCRSLTPGIAASALAGLLVRVRKEDSPHTHDEVNRIGLRTLLWSGILGDQDPALQWEYAARRRLSLRKVIETGPRPMIQLHYNRSSWNEDEEAKLLNYMMLAALYIYEEIGGNPVEAIPEEKSWRLL